jgi:hypothetical protein
MFRNLPEVTKKDHENLKRADLRTEISLMHLLWDKELQNELNITNADTVNFWVFTPCSFVVGD